MHFDCESSPQVIMSAFDTCVQPSRSRVFCTLSLFVCPATMTNLNAFQDRRAQHKLCFSSWKTTWTGTFISLQLRRFAQEMRLLIQPLPATTDRFLDSSYPRPSSSQAHTDLYVHNYAVSEPRRLALWRLGPVGCVMGGALWLSSSLNQRHHFTSGKTSSAERHDISLEAPSEHAIWE